jgi:hypothetical protein
MIGQKIGMLTVVKKALTIKNRRMWECICKCGNTKIISTSHLNGGHVQSCGCLKKEKNHGMSYTSEHYAWTDMIMRCTNPNKNQYKDWGGRGIKVCDRWLESFNNFYEDMGPKPGPNYSIDRINNDGNYEPSNCKWSTKTEQNRNKRSTKLNMIIVNNIRDDFNSGKITNKSELARKYKISNTNLHNILENKTWK